MTNQTPTSLPADDIFAELLAESKAWQERKALERAQAASKSLLRKKISTASTPREEKAAAEAELHSILEQEWEFSGYALLLHQNTCRCCKGLETSVQGWMEKQRHRKAAAYRWKVIEPIVPPLEYELISQQGEVPICLECLEKQGEWVPGTLIPGICRSIRKVAGIAAFLDRSVEMEEEVERLEQEVGLGKEIGEEVGKLVMFRNQAS